jgi:uncharacterized membrane protein
MNKILTDIGSWLNLILCASLVKVYFAESYSSVSKLFNKYEGSCCFKFKTIFKNYFYCCSYDEEFEKEREHVESILKDLSK